MTPINYIITIIFSTVGVGGIIIYLGKRIIDKSLDMGVERYKSSLTKDLETHKSELQKETDEFRANLQIISLEHQIRYTKLHEQRGESIRQIYSLIVDLKNKLEYFTTVFQGPKWTTDSDREKEATNSHRNISNFFQINRIYFSDSICNQFDEILKLSWSIIVDMSVTKVEAASAYSGPERAEATKKWQSINSRVTSEISTAMIKLEKEFKKLIGVE
jgi:hypothetical protein